MNVANNTVESDYLPFIYQILIINRNVLKESDFFGEIYITLDMLTSYFLQ
ncbi:hypothetical protein SAMN05428975_2569 [Mucilaginibacter sp. OK268]|nr:hypothetical protein SAMN05428975_2569 [Mucilaginibacter sp. OK268]